MSDDDGESVPPEGSFPQEPGRVDSPKYSEPEEPDPHDLGPPIPEAPDPTETDAEIDPATHALFWWLVVVFNVALLALSLGVMFAAFDGNYTLGAQVFAVGAVLFAYGYLRYRKFEREKDADGGENEEGDGGGEAAEEDGGGEAAEEGVDGGEAAEGGAGVGEGEADGAGEVDAAGGGEADPDRKG